jgi:hypothetical protein
MSNRVPYRGTKITVRVAWNHYPPTIRIGIKICNDNGISACSQQASTVT